VWVESVGLLGLVCEGEVQPQGYMFIFGKSFLVFFSFFICHLFCFGYIFNWENYYFCVFFMTILLNSSSFFIIFFSNFQNFKFQPDTF
jgi:hypothetical protein